MNIFKNFENPAIRVLNGPDYIFLLCIYLLLLFCTCFGKFIIIQKFKHLFVFDNLNYIKMYLCKLTFVGFAFDLISLMLVNDKTNLPSVICVYLSIYSILIMAIYFLVDLILAIRFIKIEHRNNYITHKKYKYRIIF